MANLGKGNNVEAELWGICKGLELAWEMGEKKIIVETDSKTSLDIIQGGNQLSPHYNIILRIRKLMSQNWECKLQHAWREGNKCADWLAKKSLDEEAGWRPLMEPPDKLKELLGADVLGVSSSRFVKY